MPRLIPIDEKKLAEINRREALLQYPQEAYEKRSEA